MTSFATRLEIAKEFLAASEGKKVVTVSRPLFEALVKMVDDTAAAGVEKKKRSSRHENEKNRLNEKIKEQQTHIQFLEEKLRRVSRK